MIFKYKLIVVISLLAVINASKSDINSEKNNSIVKDILENDNNSDVTENKNPSKRGVFYQGHHGLFPEAYSSSYYGYQIPNFSGHALNKPFFSGSRPIAVSAPAGFGASIHYANSAGEIFGNGIPPVHTHPSTTHFGVPAIPGTAIAPASPAIFGNAISPIHTHPAPIHFANPVAAVAPNVPIQYVIRPGGAVVQSYNVNYPQLQYQHHKHYPTYPVAGVPIPAAIAPAAPVVPINNLHYHHPTFAAPPAHVGFSFPTGPAVAPPVAQIAPQHFFVNRPPAIGIQFAAAPTPILPQRPAFVAFASPSPTIGTFPSVIPIASGSAISPGHIPAPTHVTPTHPTTLATPWRPILINNTPTTTATPQPTGSAANRPPISLLPPYGIADRPNEDYSHYYNAQAQQQNQQELAEQNYYADQANNNGYHY